MQLRHKRDYSRVYATIAKYRAREAHLLRRILEKVEEFVEFEGMQWPTIVPWTNDYTSSGASIDFVAARIRLSVHVYSTKTSTTNPTQTLDFMTANLWANYGFSSWRHLYDQPGFSQTPFTKIRDIYYTIEDVELYVTALTHLRKAQYPF